MDKKLKALIRKMILDSIKDLQTQFAKDEISDWEFEERMVSLANQLFELSDMNETEWDI